MNGYNAVKLEYGLNDNIKHANISDFKKHSIMDLIIIYSTMLICFGTCFAWLVFLIWLFVKCLMYVFF